MGERGGAGRRSKPVRHLRDFQSQNLANSRTWAAAVRDNVRTLEARRNGTKCSPPPPTSSAFNHSTTNSAPGNGGRKGNKVSKPITRPSGVAASAAAASTGVASTAAVFAVEVSGVNVLPTVG